MSIVFDLNSAADAGKIAGAMRARVSRLVMASALELFRQLAISTPVDTGRARFGWYCTVGAPSNEVPPKGEYQIPDIVGHFPVGEESFAVSDVAYLANNVPYIGKLNNGHSKQAPARFVERAASRVQIAMIKIAGEVK